MPPGVRQALGLLEAGDAAAALACCNEVLNRHPEQPAALLIAGAAQGRLGDYPAARATLEAANAADPGNIHILNNLALANKHLGDRQRAVELLQEALALAPAFIEARMHLADLQQEMGLADAARLGYTQVLQFRPAHPGALGALAALAETEGDRQTSRLFVERALRAAPHHAAANLTAAALDFADGRYPAVIERLTALLGTPGLTVVNQTIAYTRRGLAHEKLERYQAAFEDFRRSNELAYPHHAPRWADAQTAFSPVVLRRIAADLETADAAFPTAGDDEPQPVFLLGFPRSGTTLLEQILAAHPAIATIEESDTLADLYPLLASEAQPLRALAGLRRPELDEYRAAYWRRLAGAAPAGGRLIVDKQPLYTALLPVIGTLFPGARIVFALRDPRDVIVSCYQQNFAMNEAMFQFLRLDTAVDYYDRVMTIGRAALHRFGPAHTIVRYESLVRDFVPEIEKLIAFLGLPWDDCLHEYRALTAGRRIDTPSAPQVRQPLYRSAAGKWRHYRPWLPPSFGAVEHWAARWGY